MNFKLKKKNDYNRSFGIEIGAANNLEENGLKNGQKKKISKYFYRVNGHPALVSLGKSFCNDHQKGIKSFAITSMGYAESQQKTILALSSFFDQMLNCHILIVSNNLENGYFKELFHSSTETRFSLVTQKQKDISFHRFYDHFDLVEYNAFFDLCDEEAADFSKHEMIDKILDKYDVIFWDVPNLLELKSNIKNYLPLTHKFESLSIIVRENTGKSADIEEIRSFFQGHGVSIKGLIINANK